MAGKKATSFRISPEAMKLLAKLSKDQGIAQSAVIEVLIREKVERLEQLRKMERED